MPYNPGVQNISGQLLAQGINRGVDGMVDGYKEYVVNQGKNRIVEGQLAGIVQSNPQIMSDADPETIKKLEKWRSGEAGLKDKIGLLGWANMVMEGQKQHAQYNAQQLELEQAKRRQQQLAAAQRFAQMSMQTQGGATGPLSNQALARFTSPSARDAAQVYQATGAPISEQGMIEMQKMRAQGQPKGQDLVFENPEALMKAHDPKALEYTYIVTPDGKAVIPGGKMSPRAPVAGQMEPGYEPDPVNGGVRPIKGSSADTKKQEAKAAEATKLAMHITRADVILNTIKDVLPQVGALSSGFIGGLSKAVPGTPAFDVAKRIETIKANIGIEQLQAMREASKTGASGFGQLAVKELDGLQASMGNLEVAQSKGQFLKALSDVQNHYERWKKTVSGIDPDEKPKTAAESILEKYGIKK